MFAAYDDLDAPDTYAFVRGSMGEPDVFEYARLGLGNLLTYVFDAYWIVRRGKSVGALAYGQVEIKMFDVFSMEMDGLNTYEGLSEEQVLECADNLRRGHTAIGQERFHVLSKKQVKSKPSAVFGEIDGAEEEDKRFTMWCNPDFRREDFDKLYGYWNNMDKIYEDHSVMRLRLGDY